MDTVHRILARELADGTIAPGAGLSVKDLTERFNVSGTPVREALERLVGEGMTAVSGDRAGFVARRLGLGGYLSANEVLAMIVQAIAKTAAPPPTDLHTDTSAEADAEPRMIIEDAFRGVIDRTDNHVAVWITDRLANILGPYRQVEPHVIPDWRAQVQALSSGLRGPRASVALRNYVAVRRRFAPLIVDGVERHHMLHF